MSHPFPTFSRWTCALIAWASKQTYFSIAAWYCLVAPLLASGFATLICFLEGPYERHHRVLVSFINEFQANDIQCWVCVSSLVVGLVSLFGMRRHGLNAILWKTIFGILASGLFGLAAVFAPSA
jgi:uncharacterized membrane protein